MNWQLAAVYAIIVLAVAAFVRNVFFSKKHGCDCCEHRDSCPGCTLKEKEGCANCHKNNTKI
ncbi:MAG: hypothetical protein K2M06_05495 [Muribaculaceae bacterium]|nr:hypothetical protein [Muribaculaceae bacterium]